MTSGTSERMEAKGHASTIGVGCQYDPGRTPGRGHWLLVRRSIADPEDLAYYACFGTGDVSWRNWCAWPALGGSSKTPSRRPSRRWGWTSTKCACGSARHITLAMLAHAFLAVTRSYAAGGDGKRGICSRENSSH